MRPLLLAVCLFATSVSAEAKKEPVAPADKTAAPVISVKLTPHAPEGRMRMRWSPKGAKIKLKQTSRGLGGQVAIGLKGQKPIGLSLEKSQDAEHYNTLWVDANRDGQRDESEVLSTKVRESREKFWSSFKTELQLPLSLDGSKPGTRVFPINLWFVADPSEPDAPLLMRWSRSGWHEGTVDIDGKTALVMISERALDGRFTNADFWAMGGDHTEVFNIRNGSPMSKHAWFGEQAFRIVSCDPSGRELKIAPYDPGMTRAEEIEAKDYLAADRREARADKPLVFMHDYAKAEALAKAEGKRLLVDFETTWCGPCKLMDKWVYTAKRVVDAAEANGVIAVKVDGDQHKQLVKRFKVGGYPTMILLSDAGKEIRRASGYNSVKKMAEFLK